MFFIFNFNVRAAVVFGGGNGNGESCDGFSFRGGGGRRKPWSLMELCVFVIALLWMVPAGADAKWVEGVVDTTHSSWEFLTRFCFLSTHGTMEYEIQYPVGYGTQDILLYFDTPGQWDAIYDKGKNCDQKTSVLSANSNQIISLNTSHTQTSAYSGCSLIQKDGDTWYNCVGKRAFRSMRERWWYVALARCGDPKDTVTGLFARYKIHMTNGDDLFHQEYSADEFYIFPINIAFLFLYVIMTILSGICAAILRKRNLFHSTYKLFMVSIAMWTLSLVLKVVAWGYYGVSGWEWNNVEVSGRVLQGLSQVVFILLLILMAKGYTITRGFLTTSSIVKITVFISFYFVTTCALFVWERIFFDPGKVLYFYESPPGYSMVALQLVAWCWFLYSAVFTLKHTDTKSLFYMPFFTFYTIWFWAGPIIVMVAMFAISKWSREKTVNGVEQLVAFLGHAIFLVLTRPSAANSNFPYHVRVTQIDTMTDDKSNYHFDQKDVDNYVIKKGPDLDFFITGGSNKPKKSSRDDIDNISTVSFDGDTMSSHFVDDDRGRGRGGNSDANYNNNNKGRRPQQPQGVGDLPDCPPPVDLKNCWFDIRTPPPDYEEASNSSGRGQPPGFPPLPAFPHAPPLTTNLPPLPPPPASLLPREIPLALISPPSLQNSNPAYMDVDHDLGGEVPIRPRLSIVSETVLPFKKSLPPVAPPTFRLNPLPENFLQSINNPHPPPNFPPAFNSNNTTTNNNSPFRINPSSFNNQAPPPPNFNPAFNNNCNSNENSPFKTTPFTPPNQAAPTPNFNNFASGGPNTNFNPLLQLTPPSPNTNRNLNNNNNNKNNNEYANNLQPQFPPPPPPPLLSSDPKIPQHTITPAHTLEPLAFTPPTPRSNKHTFSSTIALLTKTADATNIDDIVDHHRENAKKNGNKKNNKKKDKKGKGKKVIVSQTLEERESKFYEDDNNTRSLDTGTMNSLAPVGQITPRISPRMRLPADMPPLPPANLLVEKYLK